MFAEMSDAFVVELSLLLLGCFSTAVQKVMSPTAQDTKVEPVETSPETLHDSPTALMTMVMCNSSWYLSKKAYDIPLLKDNGSNYTAWKFRQTTVLRLQGLYGVVNRTEHMLGVLTDAEMCDKTKVQERTWDIEKWCWHDQEAHAQITLAMEDSALADVVETTTVHEAWTHVIERWEGKGMQLLSFLYQQLTTIKIEEEEDLTTGFNNLCAIAAKMKTLGEPVSNLMLAQIMMCALPPSYAIVSTVIQTLNQHGSISSNNVVKAVLAEEEHHKKGVRLTAMFMHTSKAKAPKAKANPKGKKNDHGPPCQNCAKPRHTKVDCWVKGGGAEGNGLHQKHCTTKQTKKDESKSESAKLAVSGDGSESVPTLYVLPAIDQKATTNAWLLDLGALQHMMPNHHWFSSYQPLASPIQIRVGDGNTIPAVGISHILANLRTCKGTETEAIIKLVLHIPEFNTSLLLVCKLVKGGTSIVFQKGAGAVLIVSNRNGPEIGYVRELGQLYRLDVHIACTEATAYTGFVEPVSQNDHSDNKVQEFTAYTASSVVCTDLTTCTTPFLTISRTYS
jgi:hypothetical protein